jgi:ADP-ribose pyrophosphatase YjhB (NUDIX family)
MTGQLSTSPNAAIPAGLRKRAYDQTALDAATGAAAGVLHVAPDGDILLLKRGGEEGRDNFVGHWALPGGGVEAGETPELGAIRENREEMGVDIDPASLRDFDKKATPTGMAFHTFATKAPSKFCPTLNDEHLGYGWFSLKSLPQPLHPAVEASLKERLGDASELGEDEWGTSRDGLMRWLDGAEDDADELASDSACCMALDRDTVREKTRDGRLVVKKTNVTKANVCPYRGEEIPGWQSLGLEADRVYNLLRDPEELRKGANSLNGVQLLIKHIPVNAKDHRPSETIGSLGSDADFDGTYVTNSLFVNAQHAIDVIESGAQRELSAGYHYTPDMTPGNFNGTAYDGVMRDIVFNHVALVEDGRAGPDVVVGDEALKGDDDMKTIRFAALLLGSTAAHIAPLMAMDSKVTLPKDVFRSATPKTFKDAKPAILAAVRTAIDGKLRPGIALDASMEGLAKAIDAFGGLEEEIKDDADLDAAAEVKPVEAGIAPEKTTYDAEPFKNFLREKGMGEDDIMKACDMMPKPALDSDEESDEDKKKREEAAAAKDAEMKDMVTKPAMDAAIKAAVSQVRKDEQGIRTAISEVKPWVGELPASMAFDSATAVHRQALKMLNVEGHATLHPDALLSVLKAQRKPTDRVEPRNEPALAMDASVLSKAAAMAPGFADIETL